MDNMNKLSLTGLKNISLTDIMEALYDSVFMNTEAARSAWETASQDRISFNTAQPGLNPWTFKSDAYTYLEEKGYFKKKNSNYSSHLI